MPQSESARRTILQIEPSLSFVHRTNIKRYKDLLGTDLSNSERLTVQGRLAEEEAALRRLSRRGAP